MRTKKFFYFWLAILLFAFCFFPFAQARAASIDIGISPPILRIEVTPPSDTRSPIAIQNYTDSTITLDIKIQPFQPSENDNGQVTYLSPNEPLPNIQVLENDQEVKAITLAPRQEKTLPLHIATTENEIPKDYYFSVIFISKANQNQGNQITISGGIATNVLLTIGPKAKAQGSIEEFSAPMFTEKGPVPFTLRVKNSGKHVFSLKGTILIQNMFGQTVGKVDLLEVNVLAQSVRAIPDSKLSASPNKSIVWPEEFLLGLYKANLTIALTDEGPVFTRTIYFWSFPVYVILGFTIGVIVLYILLKRVQRKLRV